MQLKATYRENFKKPINSVVIRFIIDGSQFNQDSETSEQSPILALTDLLFQHELRLFGLYPETEIQILRIREVSERLLLNSSDFRQNEETKRDLINDNNFIVSPFSSQIFSLA